MACHLFWLARVCHSDGLEMHHPEEPPISKETPRKISKASIKTNKCKEKIDGLLDIARCGYKASDLLTDLWEKTIPKQYMEKLCLFWFAHSVILERDINKLSGFPWAFMAWSFEVIPLLRKKVMDYPDEISDPRMFRSGVSSGEVVSIGGRHTDVATTRDDEYVDAQEKINMFENTPFYPYTGPSHPLSPSCSCCEYEECKNSQDKLLEKVEAMSKAIEEFKSKEGVILSKKVREPYIPTAAINRKKKAISDVLSSQK
ncbi:hypothetical protein FXO37_16271 [Capsicum annuum]|nr:hypothetical protein FXO37_16271 [Capsicum annuum]